MKQLLFLFSIFLFSFYSILGCSLKPHYLSQFDKSEYIFIGEVVGYTNLLKSNNKLSNLKTYGLIVKVKEAVNLPKTPKTHFEVLPFHLGTACQTVGVKLTELKKNYPIKSEILVVLKESSIFPHALNDGNFRLEYDFANFYLIEVSKVKNYSALTDSSLTSNLNIDDIKTLEEYEDKYSHFDFEARKDLKKLAESKTQTEKEEIINKLLKNPTSSIDFIELLKLNSKPNQEILKHYEDRLRLKKDLLLKIDNREIYSEEDIQFYLKQAKERLNESKTRPK